jgi:hypothetical protein
MALVDQKYLAFLQSKGQRKHGKVFQDCKRGDIMAEGL